MAGAAVRENRVRRLAHAAGRELLARRDQKVVAHRRRPLEPRTAVVPEAVVVEVDGGRMRTRATGTGAGRSRGPEQRKQGRVPGHAERPHVRRPKRSNVRAACGAG
jgi:hypothetical protein